MGESAGTSLKPELVSKAAFLYISTIASAIFSYIALFFATRFVGDIGYGILAFALSFSGIFLFITDLGIATSHTKKVSEGEDLQSCLSVFMVIRLALVAVFVAAVLLTLFLWEGVLGQGFESADTHLVILIILIYYVQTSITYVFTQTFLAQRDVVRAQAIALSDVASRAIATLLVVAFSWGLVGLACTYAVEGFVALAVALFLARGRLPRIRLSAAKKSLIKQYARFAAPIAATTIFGTIVLYGDKLLIQYSSVSAADTGLYYAYQRVLAFYMMLSPVMASVAYPAFSQLNAQKEGKEAISKMTTTMIRYLLLVTVPIMLFLIVFSGDILSIFLSSSFATGAMAFAILAVGYSVGLTISPFGSQTLGMGLSGTYGKYMMISTIIMIAFDFLLIPSSLFSIPLAGWGMNGAAVSLLIGQIVQAFLFYTNARKLLQLKAPSGLIGTTCAAVISIMAVYALSTYMELSRFYDLVAVFFLFAGVFIFFAVLFRAVSVKEIKDIIWMIRPKHMLHRANK